MERLEDSEPQPLQVGYGRVDITPELGCHLAGVVSRHGRVCTRLRDPLFVRALHLGTPDAEAFVVSADLLLITRELCEAVADRVGIAPETLLLHATHNHSGPGGYWDVGRGELFMGAYRQAIFDDLADRMTLAIRESRATRCLARVSAASTSLTGASANRRQLHGPVDPELLLVRFETADTPPIDVVCFGAHPVVGCEREPGACSADFPGELCARLERRGHRALFFTGAVGGLSPLFTEFPLDIDRHLELLGDLLERGVERAERGLVGLPPAALEPRSIRVPLPALSCRMFPQRGALWRLAEAAATPLRRWLVLMARDARSAEDAVLQQVSLGQLAWLGTPCDLGVSVALALKAVLRRAGVRFALVGSQCNGYVGYVHLPEDYARVPEAGFRHMASYENAMSLSGLDMGTEFVTAVETHLRAATSGEGDALSAAAARPEGGMP